jgi:hypothetical protein
MPPVSVLILAIFSLLLMPQLLHATTDPKSYFYPADSKPFGKSYQEWSALWWKFVKEYPNDARLNDVNGTLCTVNQTGNVWFLPGASSGNAFSTVNRYCTVPSGVSLLISPDDNYCTMEDQPKMGYQQLLDCAKQSLEEDTSSKAKLDGVVLSNLLETNRVQSGLFDLNIPGKNSTKAVSDGVFLMLKPLSPGKHEINLGASNNDEKDPFSYNVTYHITQK